MTGNRDITDLLHPLYLLSCVVPKSPRVWVFGSWFGERYADSPRSVFEFAHRKGEAHCVWITRSASVVRELRSGGFRAYRRASPAGIYYQLRAGAAFFSHDTDKDLLGPAISRRTLRIQLWHGTPLKKIRYSTRSGGERADARVRRLLQALFPWKKDTGYDFVPAASDVSIDHLKEAFQTPHVLVTGLPRNDVLRPGLITDQRRPIRHCIYMPTFRGEFRTQQSSADTGRFLAETGFDVDGLDRAFTGLGVDLTLRLHPTNRPDADMMKRIRASGSIRIDETPDIYETLDRYDLLITDYSSIFFDYFITGKPVIHAAFDLDSYLRQNRDLYFAYEDICLTPDIRSWSDVVHAISRLREHGIPEHYAQRYESLAARFNHYRDGASSARVYEWVSHAVAGDAAGARE